MELDIIQHRLDTEIKLYEETWTKYEDTHSALLNLEIQLLEIGLNPDQENSYKQALFERNLAYERIQKLQTVLDNHLTDFEIQKQAVELHQKRTQNIPNFNKQQRTSSIENGLSPVNVMPDQQKYSFNDQKYHQFLQRYRTRYNAAKDEYEAIANYNRPKQISHVRQKYVPGVKLNQKIESTKQEIDPDDLALYKQKLLEGLKGGQLITENPYKEFRDLIENQKIERIVQLRNQVFAQRKQTAQQVARELAERDLEFQRQVVAEKQKLNAELKTAAINTRAQNTIQRITGQPVEEVIGDTFIPDHLRQHVSLRAKQVVPAHFGLGFNQSSGKTVIFEPPQEVVQMAINKATDRIQPVDELQELIGVPQKQLQFQSKQNKSPSKKVNTPKLDAKKKDKNAAVELVEIEFSESDDLEVPTPKQNFNVPRPSKPIPLVTKNPKQMIELKTSKILSKTCQLKQVDYCFISEPSALYFYNFLPDVQMNLSIFITNNSKSLATFKILPVEERYRDMFKITYQQPGMLAPGNGVRASVQFTYNDPNMFSIQNVDTQIAIQYDGGTMFVPVKCYAQTHKIQLGADIDTVYYNYNQFAKNENMNFDINDIPTSQAIRGETLINGQTTKDLYLTNTGFQDVIVQYSLDQISVNSKIIDVMKTQDINDYIQKQNIYDQNISNLKQVILQQYEQYQQLQAAPKKPSKLPVFDFDFQNVSNVEEFQVSQIISKFGERPLNLDQDIQQFQALVRLGNPEIFTEIMQIPIEETKDSRAQTPKKDSKRKDDKIQTPKFIEKIIEKVDNSQKFLEISVPSCLLLNNKKFDEVQFKENKYQIYKQQRILQIRNEVTDIMEKKKQETISQQNNKQKPKKDAAPVIDFTNDIVYQNEFDRLEQEQLALIDQQFLDTFSMQQELFSFKQIDNTKFEFVIPSQSIVKIIYKHQPQIAEFAIIETSHSLQLFNKKYDEIQKFNVDSRFLTYISPVQLEDNQLDLKTCFYGQQYNQQFKIKMVDNDMGSISRKINMEIPPPLQKFVHLDMNSLIINVKQPVYKPKIIMNFPTKAETLQILQCSCDPCFDINIKDVDQFADTKQDLQLGEDLQQRLAHIQNIKVQIESLNSNHSQAEQLKQSIDLQIAQLLEQQALAASQPPQKGKPTKQPVINMDDLQQQLDQCNTNISNLVSQLHDFQDILVKSQQTINSEISIGSYIDVSFNIKIVISNQPEILYLKVKFSLTSEAFSVNLPLHIVQQIPINTNTIIPIDVQNCSALAQHIAIVFDKQPFINKELKICAGPNGGVNLLCAGEKRQFYVNVNPEIEKVFDLILLIEGEYGYHRCVNIHLSSFTPKFLISHQYQQIPELSINDQFCGQFTITNTQGECNYCVCQSFLDYCQDKLNNCIRISPNGGHLGKTQLIDFYIDFSPLNVAYILQELDHVDSSSQNFSSLRYIRRCIPKNQNLFSEFIQINIPILSEICENAALFSFKFMLRQPIISVNDVSPIRGNSPKRLASPIPGQKIKEEKSPVKKVKGKAEVIIEQPVEPQVQPIQTVSSILTTSFGQCPIGGKMQKKLMLTLGQGCQSCYIRETFVPFFDADIELRSFVDSKTLDHSKVLIFAFNPIVLGNHSEEFTFSCFEDATMKKKLNDIKIIVTGEAIQVNLNILIENQVVVSALSMTPQEERAKTPNKNAKDKTALPVIQNQMIFEHFLKPCHVNTVQSIKVSITTQLTEPFITNLVQLEQFADCAVTVSASQVTIQNSQPQSFVIQVKPRASFPTGIVIPFEIQAGDFKKKLNIYVFCNNINQWYFIKSADGSRRLGNQFKQDDQVIVCSIEGVANIEEPGVVAKGPLQIIQPGSLDQLKSVKFDVSGIYQFSINQQIYKLFK